ncbi:hypothetical protein [Mycolicibacterium brisbanense]|uniref:hypothetical protein n=1 Tax=Mycolicibacterium brisbanense TaxID=146020 RepID=UPI0007A0A2E0|nr:hypothetical protein [Mycolicibacterium brisbanense]MCV7160219.1 hypothetical protein [Mycolicibacterium brisbanense]
MPNRRRRKLSTAMRAVAAVAVASPAALVAVTQLSPEPQQREFTQAAMVTDLPTELMSALSQGLSQFGINLPGGLLGGTGASPSLASPTLTSPGLGAPGLTSPGLTSPGLTSPGLTNPGLTSPGLASPGLTAPGGAGLPGATPGATPSLTAPGALTDPALSNPALSNPALTNPAGALPGGLTNPAGALPGGLTNPAGAVPGGLTTPSLGAPTTPGLTTPGLGTDPSLMPISNGGALPAPGEVPIAGDPGLGGTYPILGGPLGTDPSLSAMPAASSGGGGLFGDLSSAAQQLGAGQAIDLLKGMVMPAITSAMKQGIPAAAPPVPAPPAPPLPTP